MPRPQKCRRICSYPDYWSFSPEDGKAETVNITLDEYEALRLIDWMGNTQEEAADEMQVARTTVTAIYDSVRKKIADALVNGKKIVFCGGSYRLREAESKININRKGLNIMRIAVTYENGQVFQHFGHSEYFKIYDVENGAVVSEKVLGTDGQGHGALAGFLRHAEVDTLVCGGIGGGAKSAMEEAGIDLYAGISGNADEAVKALISGNLLKNEDATCNHHEGHHNCGEHHGEGHNCGKHRGEDHKCGEQHR